MVRLLAWLACLGGCASWINDQASESTYRVVEKSLEAAPRQSDLELTRDALASGIMQLDAFALAYPNHSGFKVLHANALCQYAVTFVFDDWEDASLMGRTVDAEHSAERLSGLLASCEDAQRARLPAAWTTKQLPTMTRDQVEPVLWLATVGAVRLALDPMKGLAQLPAIRAELSRCAKLSPGFQDSSAEILLGTLKAGQATFLGGDDGADDFKAAKKVSGEGVLVVDVMFARGVAVARKDRTLFTSTLDRVLATDLTKWPEHRLANEAARKKARRYLAAVDKLLPR